MYHRNQLSDSIAMWCSATLQIVQHIVPGRSPMSPTRRRRRSSALTLAVSAAASLVLLVSGPPIITASMGCGMYGEFVGDACPTEEEMDQICLDHMSDHCLPPNEPICTSRSDDEPTPLMVLCFYRYPD